MSIVVPLEQLSDTIDEFGPLAFLLSTGKDGGPRAVSVEVTVVEGQIRAPIGNRTAANIVAQPLVCLLWPTVGKDRLSLIVDGQGQVLSGVGADRGGDTVLIRPTSAVRHQSAAPA